MAQTSRVARAAGFGVAAAMLLGGAYVAYQGMQNMWGPLDCSAMSSTECAFEHELRSNMGRLQIIFGVAMLVLSFALYFLWSRSKPPSQEQGAGT